MHGSLFRRTFLGMMSAMLVVVAIFTGLVTTMLQQQRQIAYENEVRLQAREIAESMTQLNRISTVRANTTLQHILSRRISEIQSTYTADIWIISFTGGVINIQVLDSNWNTSETTTSTNVTEQLTRLANGEEIRETGLFPELGSSIVTIGVPWVYTDGRVVGAVLLHISDDALTVSKREVLLMILPCLLAACVLTLVVSAFLAHKQTQPIREIDNTVRAFTKGDLTSRVELHCGGELEELGNSINRMVSELSQLEDSRRDFVAAASHELRSPMTCMRGYVQAMLDGTIPPEEMPHYLTIVLDETRRLTDLVRDLLEMSRIESGKFPMDKQPFDANELLRRILINYEPRISEKELQVEVALAPDPCGALGDTARITQVLSNFIDNAVKFLPHGGTLRVSTEDLGNEVRFAVTNNGPAIAEKDLPHIFERFYKADKAHTSGNGTGLGLSICRLIVREHGSDILVHSTPENTEFSFTLRKAALALEKKHDLG